MTKNHLRLRDLRSSDQPEGRYDLIRSPVRIGRGPRCEIRLHSDDIADVQAILRRDGDCWKIHPVGPGKDCQVNQKPLVDAVNLTAGSRFTIGHVQFVMDGPESIFSQLPTLVNSVNNNLSEPDTRPTVEKASSAPIAIQTIPKQDVVSEINANLEQPVTESVEYVTSDVAPEPIVRPVIVEVHTLPDLAADVIQMAARPVPNIAIEIKSVAMAIEPSEIQKPTEHCKIEIEAPSIGVPHGSLLQKVTRTLRHSGKPASSVLLNENWSAVQKNEIAVHVVNQPHKSSPAPKNTNRAIVDDSFNLFGETPQPSTNAHSKPILNSHAQATSLPTSLSAWADDFSRRYRSAAVPAGQSLTPTISNDLDPSLFQTSSTIPVVSKESSSRIWDDSLFEIPAASIATEVSASPSDGITENALPDVDEIQFAEPISCETTVESVPSELHFEPGFGCDSVNDQDINSESLEKPVLVIQNLSAFVQILPESHSADTLLPGSGSISQELQTEHLVPDSLEKSNELSIADKPELLLQSIESINYAANDSDSLGLSEVLDSDFSLQHAIESINPAAEDHTPHAPYLLQQRSSQVDFETWLANVGSILEDVELVEQKIDVIPDIEPEQDVVQPDDQVESESVEIIIDPENHRISATDNFVESIAPSIEKVDKAGSLERPQEDLVKHLDGSLIPNLESFEHLNAHSAVQNQDRHESDEQQWPSVGDILKWSATRSGVPPFQQNSKNEIQNTEPESLEPGQFLRMNLPIAMICSSILTFGTIGLAAIAWTMSAQDNLSQLAISSVLSASQSGQPPRLSAPMMDSLTQNRPWWQITADQIWWRATFLKMREVNGLPVADSSQVLAERALQNNPVHSPARLWKAITQVSESDQNLWSGLSRDVISLTLSADHFRRIGEEDRAAEADKEALEMATSPEQLFRLQEVVFDAELGTERFLLPGQSQSILILKRLVKEPDPVKTILAVLPENKPVVWLTAAQIVRQNGLGDYSELVKRVLEAAPDQPLKGLLSERLSLAVRAEALAMNHEMDQAIEVYRRLAQQSPPSDWTRSWYFNLGALNNQNQKPEDALVFWRKARGDDPNHQVDRHAIQATRSFAATSAAPAISNASTTIRAN